MHLIHLPQLQRRLQLHNRHSTHLRPQLQLHSNPLTRSELLHNKLRQLLHPLILLDLLRLQFSKTRINLAPSHQLANSNSQQWATLSVRPLLRQCSTSQVGNSAGNSAGNSVACSNNSKQCREEACTTQCRAEQVPTQEWVKRSLEQRRTPQRLKNQSGTMHGVLVPRCLT